MRLVLLRVLCLAWFLALSCGGAGTPAPDAGPGRVGTILGRVVLADSADASGVALSLLAGGVLVSTASTNPPGNYAFADVPAGRYAVRAEKTGYRTVTSAEIDVPADRITTVPTITLERL